MVVRCILVMVVETGISPQGNGGINVSMPMLQKAMQ